MSGAGKMGRGEREKGILRMDRSELRNNLDKLKKQQKLEINPFV